MSVLSDILKSEKGIAGLALTIGATVLTALGKMTIEQWITYTEVIYLGYAGGTGLRAIGIGLANRGNRTDTGGEPPPAG